MNLTIFVFRHLTGEHAVMTLSARPFSNNNVPLRVRFSLQSGINGLSHLIPISRVQFQFDTIDIRIRIT
jgi:hypothetical protein